MPDFPPAGKVVPLKLDEPKDAALTYVRAIGWGDVETAKAASIGTDRQRRWALSTANMVNGLRAFDDAMNAHFGIRAASTHMNVVNALNSLTIEPEDAINNSDVQMNVDRKSAKLLAKGKIFAAHMVYASRVRLDGNVWKVDVPAILDAYPALAAKNDSPDLDRLVEVGASMRNLANEIKAGKYASVEDAEAAAGAVTPQ